MDQLNKVLFCLLSLVLASCGVKGRPLPPLNPPTLGRGEPTYSEATKNKNTTKKSQSNSSDEEETAYPEEEQ
jgi:predicted small lipoprotein YifL